MKIQQLHGHVCSGRVYDNQCTHTNQCCQSSGVSHRVVREMAAAQLCWSYYDLP